jgi:hypothetical protein
LSGVERGRDAGGEGGEEVELGDADDEEVAVRDQAEKGR